jgi:hypothetical protein
VLLRESLAAGVELELAAAAGVLPAAELTPVTIGLGRELAAAAAVWCGAVGRLAGRAGWRTCLRVCMFAVVWWRTAKSSP